MKRVLITGNTSGLGKSLERVYSNSGYEVVTISRSDSPNSKNHHIINFEDIENLKRQIGNIVSGKKFDHVFINAGTLGELKRSEDISHREFLSVMKINVLSTKIIVDRLILENNAKEIICISSGASYKPYYGWSLYCSSKSVLRHMFRCYQEENKHIKFLSLNPGPVKTKMQEEVLSYDEKVIPSVSKFKEIQSIIPGPNEKALQIYEKLDIFFEKSKDGYYDTREDSNEN
jgi:benzil reductase ((S)-benzoin forming)